MIKFMTHHFTKGDTVTVYNSVLGGKPIIEGKAEIAAPTEVGFQYKVRFQHEPNTTYVRFVYPGECQDDPEGYIAKAVAEWEQSQNKNCA